jgi:hypothetical protein
MCLIICQTKAACDLVLIPSVQLLNILSCFVIDVILMWLLQDLASALNHSVHALYANGNPNALEALLPEPFGLLHRTLLAAPLPHQVCV